MGKDKITFNIGDMVFAKVRGYPAWPARISSVVDPRPATLKYCVYFFGTSETATVLAKDICAYAENKDKLGKSVKRKFFKEGLEELEVELEKIANGEESTVGLWTSEENAELMIKKNVRKSKVKSDDSRNDSMEDEAQQTTKGKPGKRKRESEDFEGEGDGVTKKKRLSTKDKEKDETGDGSAKELISRSGRVIKPKKFLYDAEGEDPDAKSKITKAPTTPAPTPVVNMSPPQESKKETIMKKPPPKEVSKSPLKPCPRNKDFGRIMWAKTKDGQMVQIKLDYDRPSKFKDDRSRMMWERATDINAKRLKTEIESGEINRDDIKLQLKPTEEQMAQLTAEQLHEMKKSRIMERKRGKLRWLKLETRLVDIDVLIKTCLQKAEVDVDKALLLMDELINMPLDPLMLKKHPNIVDTTKKLRQYVGNLAEWKLTSEEKTLFEAKAYKIRQKANILYNKYASLFAVPENNDFWKFFLDSVKEFTRLTQDMTLERMYGLIVDPTSPYFKDVCEQHKEEEDFKLKLKEAKEETMNKSSERDEPKEEVKTDGTEEQN